LIGDLEEARELLVGKNVEISRVDMPSAEGVVESVSGKEGKSILYVKLEDEAAEVPVWSYTEVTVL